MKSLALIGTACLAAGAVGQEPKKQDLSSLPIEDLMKIEVVTASKFAQALKNVSAAIYVLGGDEIRRSGARTLPDMLRGIPGVHVASIDANKWMISIRGFNGRYSNKLQVLIDGRSIYTPLFSGVNWDEHDVDPDDIDRIEVIRGPGGALWGANAVNGIINIITRPAVETQGVAVDVAAGNPMDHDVRARYGGKIGDRGFFRIYAKAFGFDDLQSTLDTDANDGWHGMRLGFRADWETSPEDRLSVAGQAAWMKVGQIMEFPTLTAPYTEIQTYRRDNSNGHLTAAWTHSPAHGSTVESKLSYSVLGRNDPEAETKRHTLDVELRFADELGDGSNRTYGLNYRHTSDRTQSTPYANFDSERRREQTYGAFYQMERKFGSGVTLSGGARLDHFQRLGWLFQPNVRVAWQPNPKETYWASASQAVRTPSRGERDGRIWVRTEDTNMGPAAVFIEGRENQREEKIAAVEAGWRFQPNARSFYDVVAFVNWYDGLRSFEPLEPRLVSEPFPHLETPFRFDNKLNARTAGVEFAGEFAPCPDWRLRLTYSLFDADFSFDRDSQDPFGLNTTDRGAFSPRHMASLRSSHVLKGGFTFDLRASYVDALRAIVVSSYTRLDARLAWRLRPDFEASIVGQNLLDRRRREGEPSLFETTSYVRRGIYGMLAWRY